jgi:hypothetical protein
MYVQFGYYYLLNIDWNFFVVRLFIIFKKKKIKIKGKLFFFSLSLSPLNYCLIGIENQNVYIVDEFLIFLLALSLSLSFYFNKNISCFTVNIYL